MPPPRMLLVALLAIACLLLGVALVGVSGETRSPRPVLAAVPVMPGPVAVLREWDLKRASAWAAGDVADLRSLYVPRSTAGEQDVARLTRWLDQGLRVRRIETQVLRVRLLEQRRDAVVLVVTDRIARAETSSGLRLPRDGPSTWRITMRRVAGERRVAAVSR